MPFLEGFFLGALVGFAMGIALNAVILPAAITAWRLMIQAGGER